MRQLVPISWLVALLIAATLSSGCNPSSSVQEESLPAGSHPIIQTPNAEPVGCDEPAANPIIDYDVRQTPSLPEPKARQPLHDPVFGTCLIRVSDRHTDLSPDDASAGLKNEYSRVQSFNADGSRFILRGIEATWYLYDSRTLQPLAEMPLEVEPRWDADDASRIYYTDESRLMVFDIDSWEAAIVHDFAADFPSVSIGAVWTRYEGSPSMDGRYWGFMVQDEEWRTVGLLIYDLIEDKITASRSLSGAPDIDSVTITPLGAYFLAYFDYCEYGAMGTEENPCGLMVYNSQLENSRGLLRIVGHSDTAIDSAGNEVLVYQDIDSDHISMLDLQTGEITPLWPIDFSYSPIGLHFSGRAFDAPGWVLVSTYSGAQPEAKTWMDDSIFALQLEPGGQVIRLAHTHSLVDEDQEHDYWAEPHASPNSDFTRILFTSNWGRSGTGEVETYMIQLPENWWKMTSGS